MSYSPWLDEVLRETAAWPDSKQLTVIDVNQCQVTEWKGWVEAFSRAIEADYLRWDTF